MSEETVELTDEQKLEERLNKMGPPQPDKSEAELRQLAIEMVEGKIFGDWQVDDDATVRLVFLPLSFCGPAQLPRNIGGIYEYVNQAGPRAINGYPMFMTMQFMTDKDREAIIPMIKEYVELQAKFRGGSTQGESTNEPTTT